MKNKYSIAIDGPAGAGKSTVSRAVARALGYEYVDTGAMYRACAWKALHKGVKPSSVAGAAKVARSLKVRFEQAGGSVKTLVDDADVSLAIRTQEVSQAASVIAVIPSVRRVLQDLQRKMAAQGGVVMEGRDIGTVVLPRADFKFYLDASPLERARRRYKELKGQGKRVNLRAIAEAIERRDRRDTSRKDSPLRPAADANLIDTTRISQEEVIGLLLKTVRGRGAGPLGRPTPQSFGPNHDLKGGRPS